MGASPDQEKTVASQPAVLLNLDIAFIHQLSTGYYGEITYRLLIIHFIPYGAQRDCSCPGHGHRHGP